MALEDKVECLRCFCEGALELADISASIDKVFGIGCKGEQLPLEGTLLSSIHRAKGLEANRVFLLRPELLPHPMAKTPQAKEQENHLRWVATTRAIHSFMYVDGSRKDERGE